MSMANVQLLSCSAEKIIRFPNKPTQLNACLKKTRTDNYPGLNTCLMCDYFSDDIFRVSNTFQTQADAAPCGCASHLLI